MQRDATAAIARRQQWQTIPIEDCPRTLQSATQEPCREVGAWFVVLCGMPDSIVGFWWWQQLNGKYA